MWAWNATRTGSLTRSARSRGWNARPASLFGNIATTAKLITAAAYAREESRGGHYRSDFTQARAPWRHRTLITLKDAARIAEAAIAEDSGTRSAGLAADLSAAGVRAIP